MPILLVLLFLVVLVVLFTRNRPQRLAAKTCRWKLDPRTKDNSLNRYVCLDCHVDAFTSTGKPPKGCKRQYRDIS